MKNAGRIMPLPRGEYNSAVTYNLLDFVTHDGSSYICKKESAGNTPSENSEYWQLMARKGSSGGAVTGVKGNAETAYRHGNVNITKDNIGLNNVANERQYSALNPQPSVAGSSGSCTGNSATATKATQDKNGNDIVNTYATKVEMNAVKKSVSDGKTLVANAITAKGVTTATDAEFATMATNIGRIQTGVNTSDATAVAANILSGKTAYVKGSKVTGTMAEKAGVTVDATATTQDSNYTYLNLPEGHYSTTSKVRTPNSNISYGLTNLTLVDSFFDNTSGNDGVNDYYFTPPQNGLYTIMVYATGNRSITAVYKNDVDISNTFLHDTSNFSSAFTLLSANLKTIDRIKIHVENHSVPGTLQYWIYR